MGIQECCQAIVVVFLGCKVCAAKIGCLSHAPRGHDAHKLVEVGILAPYRLIQRLCQSLQYEQQMLITQNSITWLQKPHVLLRG